MQLSSRQLARLHHGGILFLEALAESRRALQVFVDAAENASLFAGNQGLGGEVVDAVVEAALHETRVHLVWSACWFFYFIFCLFIFVGYGNAES